jgi:hypothetical protein
MMSQKVTKINTYFAPEQTREAAHYLATNGFVVILANTSEKTDHLRADFKKAVEAFPEFRRDLPVIAKTRQYTRGGFGALGSASSFHNHFVRSVRIAAHRCLARFFRELITADLNTPNKYLAQVADRMMIREAGVSATSEDWHRDIHEGGLASDQFFGGWLNLGAASDVFICKAATHQPEFLDEQQKGFSKVLDKSLIDELNAVHEEVTVPPGAIIIIDETILHKVNGKASKVDKFRVFVAWLLPSNAGSVFPDGMMEMIENQSVVTIKSGQIPPMYPATDVMYRIGDLINWGATQLQPCMMELRKRSETAVVFAGQTLLTPLRFAPSLKKAGLLMYPPYASYEKNIFVASLVHEIPFPNSTEMQNFRYDNQ